MSTDIYKPYNKVGWIFDRLFTGSGFNTEDKLANGGKFIKVTTFSTADSTMLSTALGEPNKKVFFTDNGVVSIQGGKTFPNLLTGMKTVSSTGDTSAVKIAADKNDAYVFSQPLGYWGLYKKAADQVYLFYNPLNRPEITVQTKNAGLTSVKNDIAQTCEDVKGAASICNCIDGPKDTQKFCMSGVMGSETARKAYQKMDNNNYNKTEELCDCYATSCPKDTIFVRDFYRKEGIGKTCPANLVMSVCNTSISAGRDLNAKGPINVAQACGASSESPAPAPAPAPATAAKTPAPAPAPATAAKTPAPAPAPTTAAKTPAPAPAPTTASKTTAPTTASKTTAPAPAQDNTPMLIGGAVVVLALAAGAYFYTKK
jgi:hypothetical protein